MSAVVSVCALRVRSEGHIAMRKALCVKRRLRGAGGMQLGLCERHSGIYRRKRLVPHLRGSQDFESKLNSELPRG